ILEGVPFLIVLGIDRGSDHIDGDLLLEIQGDQFLQKIPAIHDGHIDVQKDDLWDLPPLGGPITQGVECLLSVLENLYIITLGHGFEDLFYTEDGNGIIIHDEYTLYYLHRFFTGF